MACTFHSPVGLDKLITYLARTGMSLCILQIQLSGLIFLTSPNPF